MVQVNRHNLKDTAIRIRINSQTKDDAENILHSMGLTISQAIHMYLVQIVANQAIPFSIQVPNKETAQAIREAKAGKGLIKSNSMEDLFNELGI